MAFNYSFRVNLVILVYNNLNLWYNVSIVSSKDVVNNVW